jgi:uncharacterized protein (DUF433 family)
MEHPQNINPNDGSQMIDRFETWKAKLVNNPNILGGETVFPGSRLSVQRIGRSLERGETLEVLRKDYPYLTDEDFNFARIFIKKNQKPSTTLKMDAVDTP